MELRFRWAVADNVDPLDAWAGGKPPHATFAARLSDFGDDIGLSISRTPIRNALAGAGAFLAVAIFVFSAAVSTTSANEVASSFDRLAATSVQLVSSQPETSPIDSRALDLPRLSGLPGVVGVGTRRRLGEISIQPGDAPWTQAGRSIAVFAVDPGATDFLALTIDGPGFSDADHALGLPAVLFGAGATRLFDTRLGAGMRVRLDGRLFVVAGVITDAERDGGTLLDVLIPSSTAERLWPSRQSSATVVMEVAVGSAATVAAEAPLAVDANHPGQILALYDPEATQLRQAIRTQVDGAAVLIGIGLLMTGAFGIAGAMVASVSERRGELGIRRALGSRRGQLVRLVMGEAILTGTIASLGGLVIGLLAFLTVAIEQGWSPVLLPEVLVGAPVAGIAAGLIAGAIPSIYASRIEPAEALRT
jgi:putative ABC transport system permease protein